MDNIEIECTAKEFGLKRRAKLKELEEAENPSILPIKDEEKENIVLLHQIKFSLKSIETMYALTVSIPTIKRIIDKSKEA